MGMTTPDLRDYGFKTGDVMRAHYPDGKVRDGLVLWEGPDEGSGRGMVFARVEDGYEVGRCSLRYLAENDVRMELIQRPQLDRTERNIAIILDDPSKQFAFSDDPDLLTSARFVTEAAMGTGFPVIVLHSSLREEFSKNAPLDWVEYTGELPAMP